MIESDISKSTRVFVSRRLPPEIEARLSALFDTRLNPEDVPRTAEELKSEIAQCHVFVPTVTDVIDADVIEAAGPDMKLIANFGAGTDHINVAAAHARGITVTNTPGVLT